MAAHIRKVTGKQILRQFRNGSVTVYLSLLLLLMLSLLAAALYSARGAACRTALASAAEQGMYSLFAQYDRDLYERFGLLFIDGGYGTSELRPGRMLRETEEDIRFVLQPATGGAGGTDLLHMQITGREVSGYLLATDGGGAAFRRQVCGISSRRLESSGLQMFGSRLLEARQQAELLQAEGSAYNEADAEMYYLQDHPGESLPGYAYGEGGDEAGGEAEGIAVPEDFVNPLDQISLLRGEALTSLVLPDPGAISAASVGRQDLVSGRQLKRGMGIPADIRRDAGEQLLLLHYLTEEFSCFCDGQEGAGLRYQLEYAIAGRNTDAENLKIVLQQLLSVREAANMAYLMGSEIRRAEASRMAAVISAILLRPDLEPAVSFALKAAWAYGESLLDLRTLLNGGRVPLLKDDGSWQLPLLSLAFVGTDLRYGSGSGSGLDYREYLQIFLSGKSSEALAGSLMDLTEHVMRTELQRPDFRLDVCIQAAELGFTAKSGSQSWQIRRRYSYDPGWGISGGGT